MNASRVLSPDAEVHDESVIWRAGPAIQVSVPKEATYVGADRWVMSGFADTELHLYVEGDSRRNVQRYYWIQFESILPQLRDRRYEPVSEPVVTVAGLPFHVATQAVSSERLLRLLMKAAWTLPRELATVQLLHRRADARSEVKLVYGEALAAGGSPDAVKQRAMQRFRVERLPG